MSFSAPHSRSRLPSPRMPSAPVAMVLILLATAVRADDISGVARVLDGDTIVVSDTRIRLSGIDSPETDQLCLNAVGIRWTCGIEAGVSTGKTGPERPPGPRRYDFWQLGPGQALVLHRRRGGGRKLSKSKR